MTRQGKLIVLSGPGGVGKSTISKELGKFRNFWISISATTRAPREGEVEGRFHFNEDLVEKYMSHDEWNEVYGAGDAGHHRA